VSIHTALRQIYLQGDEYNMVIKGHIANCYSHIPHTIIMNSVKTQIGEPIILELIKKFLKGYESPLLMGSLAQGNLRSQAAAFASVSKVGISQSDILSPILINIVLLSFDKYMEALVRTASSFRRLYYIRYADEFIVFVAGSLKDANFVRNNIIDYLRTNCGLELNTDKSAIFNLATDK